MSIAERIRHEVREVALVTLYFLVCLAFFLSLKKLFLEQYTIEITILGTAAVGALVLAKVVILLDKTSMGDRFASDRVALHLLWRTLVYTAVVFVVTLAERVFDSYRQLGELHAALTKTWAGEDAGHFLAMNLCIGFSLLIFNIWAELDRHMGEHALRDFFFASRNAADRRAEGA